MVVERMVRFVRGYGSEERCIKKVYSRIMRSRQDPKRMMGSINRRYGLFVETKRSRMIGMHAERPLPHISHDQTLPSPVSATAGALSQARVNNRSVARASARPSACCTMSDPAPACPALERCNGTKGWMRASAPETPPKFRREMHWIQHQELSGWLFAAGEVG